MNTDARTFLEKKLGRLSLGQSLRAIRQSEQVSQTAFAKQLGVSVQYLCDLEHDRKLVSPKKAQFFAKTLGYPPEQFVVLSLQDSLNYYDIPMVVEVSAA
jgi:transcriptional regulator with XRE-family HTH domain